MKNPGSGVGPGVLLDDVPRKRRSACYSVAAGYSNGA